MADLLGTHVVDAGTGDDWKQLLPAGTIVGRDGRSWRLSDPAAVIAATRALGKHLEIDLDHATDLAPPGAPKPAAGWIEGLEAREDGIWGLIRWTDLGAPLVAGLQYRYLSPVFLHRRDGEVVQLLRASLTNNPNLYLQALNARQGSTMTGLKTSVAALAQMGADAEDGELVRSLQSRLASGDQAQAALGAVAQALGLAADAGRETVLAQCRRLAHEAANPDPARYVPITQFEEVVRELGTLKAETAKEGAERAVNEAAAAGKLAPAMRGWALAYATKDPEGFRAWCSAAPALVTPGAAAAPQGKQPPAGECTLDDEDKAVCARLGIAPDDYRKHKEAR